MNRAFWIGVVLAAASVVGVVGVASTGAADGDTAASRNELDRGARGPRPAALPVDPRPTPGPLAAAPPPTATSRPDADTAAPPAPMDAGAAAESPRRPAVADRSMPSALEPPRPSRPTVALPHGALAEDVEVSPTGIVSLTRSRGTALANPPSPDGQGHGAGATPDRPAQASSSR